MCEGWVFVTQYPEFQHFIKMEHDYQRKLSHFSLLLVLTTRGIGQEPKRRRPEQAASHIPPGIFISSSHRTPSRRGNTRGQVLPGAAGLSRGKAAPRGLRSIYRGTAPRGGSPTHSPASPRTQPRTQPRTAPEPEPFSRSPAAPRSGPSSRLPLVRGSGEGGADRAAIKHHMAARKKGAAAH